MGSYDEDAWMRCVVCRRWEEEYYFLNVDGFGGVVCPRCFSYQPPRFEYLQGLFRSMLSHELIDRVATFAYCWCAPVEASDYSMEADSQIEDEADDVGASVDDDEDGADGEEADDYAEYDDD